MPETIDDAATAPLWIASSLANVARKIALAHFRAEVAVEIKDDATPVTVADRSIEAAMRKIIGANARGAGVLGEELGADQPDAQEVWVLDPIDGTGAFITGSPLFGVLIGLLRDGRPHLGVIEMPALDERWSAVRGEGARLNGAPCSTSGRARLSEASLGSTSPFVFAPEDYARFVDLAGRTAITRFGGDCYGYALVACGHLDLVVEAGLKPHDYLPIVPVIEEAGGVMSDWAGRPLDLDSDGRVVAAASAALHAEALAVLRA